MNTFTAEVVEINSVDNLNIVKFNSSGITLSMMSLELNKNIQVGTKVKLSTKPTHVAIAKAFSGEVSYSNQLKAEILHVQNGELLSSIKMQIQDATLESVITRSSSQRMNLNVGDEITALIKANEISILEVLDA